MALLRRSGSCEAVTTTSDLAGLHKDGCVTSRSLCPQRSQKSGVGASGYPKPELAKGSIRPCFIVATLRHGESPKTCPLF